ncbi:NAD(P)-binding domain-containing protein [uncultured Adlercreutzia sp.]|uniref:NAD(P)-binding domain-containing protein n=1 Tax=uncultured Adlercreutzia sp. TaxID=875803 RepID=UPI0026F3E55A|nr:NAD(P)-binding domain-containing protein [uncultured Adlercreutzia sp.]
MACLYAYEGAPSFIAAVEPRLADAGFSRVEDAVSADIVLTFYASASALEDAYLGDGGLVSRAAPGAILVDFSATTPNFARELNAVATVNDLVMVEAPVTVRSLVAPDAFSRENLLGPVASESELADTVRELLGVVFGEVVEVGAPGRAQLLRNTHTLPLAADLVSAIEAVALDDASARVVGALDADQVPLFSPVSADPVVRAVREQRWNGAYTAEMLLAELSAALMAADDAEVILPGVEATMHLLELLAVIGGSDMAPAALALVYQDEAAGARAGLDWTRAEAAYGGKGGDDDEDWSAYDDDDDACGCGHDHGEHDYDDYDDFGPDDYDFDYSSN